MTGCLFEMAVIHILSKHAQKHPALFGVPFVLLMVAASYGLSTFTQTRYDIHDQKVKQVGVTSITLRFVRS
jgi:hypothetical protein